MKQTSTRDDNRTPRREQQQQQQLSPIRYRWVSPQEITKTRPKWIWRDLSVPSLKQQQQQQQQSDRQQPRWCIDVNIDDPFVIRVEYPSEWMYRKSINFTKSPIAPNGIHMNLVDFIVWYYSIMSPLSLCSRDEQQIECAVDILISVVFLCEMFRNVTMTLSSTHLSYLDGMSGLLEFLESTKEYIFEFLLSFFYQDRGRWDGSFDPSFSHLIFDLLGCIAYERSIIPMISAHPLSRINLNHHDHDREYTTLAFFVVCSMDLFSDISQKVLNNQVVTETNR